MRKGTALRPNHLEPVKNHFIKIWTLLKPANKPPKFGRFAFCPQSKFGISLFPVLLFAFHFASAQPRIELVQQLSFKEGLSDRAVYGITRDSKGFIWIATGNGLNRYLGNEFEVFDNNANSRFQINENNIKQATEIGGGQLVLLNEREQPFFEMLDLRTFRSSLIYLNKESGLAGNVEAVFAQPLGQVYVLTEGQGGYSIYEMDGAQVFKRTCSVPISNKKEAGELRFLKSRDGSFWVLDSRNGLFHVLPNGTLLYRCPISEINRLTSPSNTSYSTSLLHEDRSGRLWAAFPFRNGLLQMDPANEGISPAAGFPENELYSGIWEDGKGRLLVGTFKGFGMLGRLYEKAGDGPPTDAQWLLDIDEKINCIYGADFSKMVFLGTHVGVYKINLAERPVRWALAERQLADGAWSEGISIRSITGDGQGNIYIARELKRWYHLDNHDFSLDTLRVNGENGRPIRLWCNSNLVYDPAGYLWGGSCTDDRSGLLHKYDLKKKTACSFPIMNKVIKHILREENGNLILVSGAIDTDGLLSFFDPETEKFSHYFDKDGSNPLAGKNPNFVYLANDKTIWVGTVEGLVGIDRQKRKSVLYSRAGGNLTNDNILAIHEDQKGRLWLGTHGGLNILDLKTRRSQCYNTSNGLCNNTVCGILPDDDGRYWLSTFYGLSCFDPKTKLFSNFYKDKGLTFNEFNRLAFYRDEKGLFYFGTLNGVNILKKSDFENAGAAQFPLQWVGLTKHLSDGSELAQRDGIAGIKSLRMRQRDDFIRLEFALPDYEKPAQNRYAMKLEGLDTAWHFLGTDPSVQISRPPPGTYKLRIKAAPAKGFWTDGELSLNIRVKQAFYQRAWFQVALPLAILLLSYLIGRWSVRRVKQREEEATRVNKKFAELELQALRSQMNPHFVFNSLGAIQFFIQNNDAGAADNYLAKFAKLMRLFLESSKNKYISLSEEIKLLSLYVELEQMRFEDRFDAEIAVDKDLDTYSRELPSILIQPFVENSINHGLFHKNGKGRLLVKFYEKENGALICRIEDDGVGRERSASLKQKSPRNYKSRGMQIVNERLEVLKQVDEIDIKIEVEDLDPNADDTGTVVTIEIPDLD
ncbi:MAG TPA: hypothetical protein ENJ95_00280 [Bacteroidetes bacterium]|nr:hypothetical protein [Bacteroidota bacterium]